MLNFVSVRKIVSASVTCKTGVSFAYGKLANGKDAKASFRLDGAVFSESEVIARLDEMTARDANKNAADREVIRVSLPKYADAVLTLSVRPVYTPAGLRSLLTSLPGFSVTAEVAPEVEHSAPPVARKGRKATKDATETAEVAAPVETPVA